MMHRLAHGFVCVVMRLRDELLDAIAAGGLCLPHAFAFAFHATVAPAAIWSKGLGLSRLIVAWDTP
jgi:hypothetical protein